MAVAETVVVVVGPQALPPKPRQPEAPATTDGSKSDAPVQTEPTPAVLDDDRLLWPRLRRGYALPPLPEDLTAPARARWAARVAVVQRALSRGADFLPFIVDELERRGLPGELALLPVLESGFHAHAVSSAQAVGPWQFMRATGRDLNLHDNLLASARRDWVASTRAALEYLGQLHKKFKGDWHLALAAYNAGAGTVAAAQKTALREGRTPAFQDLRLPEETRQYVPALLAIAATVERPDQHGLLLPYVPDKSALTEVRLTRDIDLRRLAQLIGISEPQLLHFNPALKPPIVVASLTPAVLLPDAAAARLREALSRTRGPLAGWSVHIVRRGETLTAVASRHHLPVTELRKLNGLQPGRAPAPGAALLVPRLPGADDVPRAVAVEAALSLAPIRHANGASRGRHYASRAGVKHRVRRG